MKKICCILPCFNESKRLDFDKFQFALENYLHLNYFFVDDCSTDDTLEKLQNFQNSNLDRVMILKNEKNQGKGNSIRNAVLAVDNNYDLIGFLDSDLQIPVDEFMRIASHVNGDVEISIASRIKRLGSNIERTFLRHIISRSFATVVSFSILKIPVYDSQCGAKVFDSDVAKSIFKQPFVSKWIFDVELIFRYIRLRGKERAIKGIYETPLNICYESMDSRIGFRDYMLTFRDLYTIKKIYK